MARDRGRIPGRRPVRPAKVEMSDLQDDALLARSLARSAGELLLEVRTPSSAGSPLTGRELATAGDRSAHEHLAARLAQLRPDDLVLSEEGADPEARVRADRVWIVDPLDGTREYSEGRADWAVHVALWQDGDLVAGAVALPAEGLVFDTAAPPSVPARADGAPLRVAVSRTRPPQLVHELVARLGLETVPMGSAGVKSSAVWRGQADVYVHAGGQYEWDSAAPVAVARAAGLFTSRVDGSALVYNRPDPELPDLLVCRPELADILLDELRDLVEVSA